MATLGLVLTACAAGVLLGFCASLVPGLHVNTLAALVLAAAAASGGAADAGPASAAALALVAAFAAGAFAAPVAGAFLGAPSEESAAGALPAHALLAEGRGAEAADLAALGSFGGLAFGLALAFALRPLLVGPLALFARLERAMPVLLALVALALLLSERRRVPYRRAFRPWPGGGVRLRVVRAEGAWWRLPPGSSSASPPRPPRPPRSPSDGGDDRIAVDAGYAEDARRTTHTPRRRLAIDDDAGLLDDAPEGLPLELEGEWTRRHGACSRALGVGLGVAVFSLAGALGWLAFRLGAASPLGLPASPLLPLLAGLFGAPPLVDMARAPRARPPPQVAGRAAEPWPAVARAVALGTVPGAGIGLFPGLTPAHAGAAGLALRPRAGREETLLVLGAANGAGVAFSLLAFAELGRPRSGALLAAGLLDPGRRLALLAAVALAAGCAGYFLARAAAVLLARVAGRVPERALALAVLAVLVSSTWCFTGALGLLELATAAAIGTLPLRWGVRRSHAMGVVMGPVLAGMWG